MKKIIKLNEMCEVEIGGTWTLGQVVDISEDGKTYWVETWQDTYDVSYKQVKEIEE